MTTDTCKTRQLLLTPNINPFPLVYYKLSPALCRDIKLENTLLDDAQPQPNVKICDFGYSKNEFVDSRPKTVSGTPDYIAPEVLMADQYDGKKADIWSCGVMLYVMVTGTHHSSGTPRQAISLITSLLRHCLTRTLCFTCCAAYEEQWPL